MRRRPAEAGPCSNPSVFAWGVGALAHMSLSGRSDRGQNACGSLRAWWAPRSATLTMGPAGGCVAAVPQRRVSQKSPVIVALEALGHHSSSFVPDPGCYPLGTGPRRRPFAAELERTLPTVGAVEVAWGARRSGCLFSSPASVQARLLLWGGSPERKCFAVSRGMTFGGVVPHSSRLL
jgi:hypothetical protein